MAVHELVKRMVEESKLVKLGNEVARRKGGEGGMDLKGVVRCFGEGREVGTRGSKEDGVLMSK